MTNSDQIDNKLFTQECEQIYNKKKPKPKLNQISY